jgi:hypothetical protein
MIQKSHLMLLSVREIDVYKVDAGKQRLIKRKRFMVRDFWQPCGNPLHWLDSHLAAIKFPG